MREEFCKYAFGYKVYVEKVEGKDSYVAKINELGIEGKAQSKGRAIRQVFEKINETLRVGNLEIRKSYRTDGSSLFETRILKINQKITNFGFCVIAEEISYDELEKLEVVCKNIELNKEYTIEEVEQIENSIANAMKDSILNPQKRALNMTALVMNTEHINKFSHLIEQANISLFREEYISTIMILVPVIEGTLLSLYGFDSNEKNKPRVEKLLNKWAELQPNSSYTENLHPFMVDEYIRAFINICQQTVFSAHEFSEKNLYFNRHYIAHLMGCGKFYSRNNAFKFIILGDLLTYVLAICNNQYNIFEFDSSNKSYLMRKEYYEQLYKISSEDKLKYLLLSEHTNFKGYS